jgi:chorismate dehydratase
VASVRLGAVGYLNARPLVYGLERQPRFDLRYDIPSQCATLLHAHAIDVGLIPSIEYLRGPEPYVFVPGPAVTSRGPVASVAIYTRIAPNDIRTIAMDTSSRTSVALSTVLLRRVFGVTPEAVPMAPDLDAMLARADAARGAVAKRYLRDNIRYVLGAEELEGLRTFYRYAAEAGLVPEVRELRFY